MISSTKRICNDMRSLEEENVKIIPPDDYYIIKIKFYETKPLDKSLPEKVLNETPKPLAVYYSCDTISILFSCVKGTSITSHQLNGNHNLIVSKYVRFFTQNSPQSKDITAEIIHLHSRAVIFTYLSWVVFQTTQNNFMRLSKGRITTKDLQFLTEKELKNKFSEYENWDDLDSHEKYGTLLTAKQSKNGITDFSSLSEPLDARDTKKYMVFIFGKN